MIGLEVRINGGEPVVGVTDHSLFLFLDYTRGSGGLYLGGTDRNDYRLIWINQHLDLGDKVCVKVVDTETPSPTISMEVIDRQELLRKFEELREKLIKKGAIL